MEDIIVIFQKKKKYHIFFFQNQYQQYIFFYRININNSTRLCRLFSLISFRSTEHMEYFVYPQTMVSCNNGKKSTCPVLYEDFSMDKIRLIKLKRISKNALFDSFLRICTLFKKFS